MNETELEELLARENKARQHGFQSNRYRCLKCSSEGRTEAQSTYTNWAADLIDGEPVCERHFKKP
jgi:hypothetical protein